MSSYNSTFMSTSSFESLDWSPQKSLPPSSKAAVGATGLPIAEGDYPPMVSPLSLDLHSSAAAAQPQALPAAAPATESQLLMGSTNQDAGGAGRAASLAASKGSPSKGKPVKLAKENLKGTKYQRRLALNRESAAVSRMRRRQYITDLETRLTRVEREKSELLGRVEAMLNQNREMSRQLREAFYLLASAREAPEASPS